MGDQYHRSIIDYGLSARDSLDIVESFEISDHFSNIIKVCLLLVILSVQNKIKFEKPFALYIQSFLF